jgi:hypothetical protein
MIVIIAFLLACSIAYGIYAAEALAHPDWFDLATPVEFELMPEGSKDWVRIAMEDYMNDIIEGTAQSGADYGLRFNVGGPYRAGTPTV